MLDSWRTQNAGDRSSRSGPERKTPGIGQKALKTPDVARIHRETVERTLRKVPDGLVPRAIRSQGEAPTRRDSTRSSIKTFDRGHLRDRFIERSSHIRYHDRPSLVRHSYHRVHEYLDRHRRLRHSVVWPTHSLLLHYSWGLRHTFTHFYPYYHRKYVFVSLGGWWPLRCSYRRYYWYGYHPYTWHGYYPVAREVQSDTHNYYTYNYYSNEGTVAADSIPAVDHTTFADVREKLAQQAPEPAEPTLADTYFEAAVKAFEAAQYETAAEKFARAMQLAPEDIILPFAYSQALFANGQYAEAAAVLRKVLEKIAPEKEGVFYPRGLYADDDMLLQQLDCLFEQADLRSSDPNLQLLLGYQLLGIGETDAAIAHLLSAAQDEENTLAAAVLLQLAEKVKAEKAKNEKEGTADVKAEQVQQ